MAASLSTFPRLYDDELLYSGLARWAERAGKLSMSRVSQMLFGNSDTRSNSDLPTYVGNLVTRFPAGSRYTAEYLIANHTMLPYYRPFLTRERVERAVSIMSDTRRSVSGSAVISGISAYVSRPRTMRFCVECAQNDRRREGEPYWHRIHQLPAVDICPVHRVLLSHSSVRRDRRQEHRRFATAKQCPVFRAALDAVHKVGRISRADFRLGVAQDSAYLLNSWERPIRSEHICAVLRDALGNLGLVRPGAGFVRRKALLERIGSVLDVHWLDGHTRRGGFLREIESLYQPRTAPGCANPLYWLVLFRSLGLSAESIVEGTISYRPPLVLTESRPLPCGNPICSRYGWSRSLRGVAVRKGGSVSVAVARCARCGFAYMYPKRGRILAYGPAWEEELRRLLREDVPTRDITVRLGVSLLTIHKQALRLGVAKPEWSVSQRQSLANKTFDARERASRSRNRAVYSRLRCQHPSWSRARVAHASSSATRWLCKNDRDWYESHAPGKIAHVNPGSVDWKARERSLMAEVADTERRMFAPEVFPRRYAVTSILRECPSGHLVTQYGLARMPRLAGRLQKATQRSHTYRVRRILWAERQFEAAGHCPSYREFVRVGAPGGAHIPLRHLVAQSLSRLRANPKT